MGTRTNAGRLLTGIVVTLYLAGCAAGSSPSPAPATPTPVASSSAAVTTPEPTPVAGDRTLVSGTISCVDTERDPAESPLPTPEGFPCARSTIEEGCGMVLEWYDFTCTHAMSDPRVSGTERYLYRGAYLNIPQLPGAAILWDSVPLVLTTPGGTWKGVGMGVDSFHEPTLYTLGYTVYEGEGAYAGLTYTLMWARERHVTIEGIEPYLASGWIEPKE